MSYLTIARIQIDTPLLSRCSASVAGEVSAGNAEGNAEFVGQWTVKRSWDLASTPSWDDKWESAEAGGITEPGSNEGVITDADILSRVQQLLAQYPLTDLNPPP